MARAAFHTLRKSRLQRVFPKSSVADDARLLNIVIHLRLP